MRDKNLPFDSTYQVSHDNHYSLIIHMINGDNILIESHHIEENIRAINALLCRDAPFYIYEVKGIQPYRPTLFTRTKLCMLRDALAEALH